MSTTRSSAPARLVQNSVCVNNQATGVIDGNCMEMTATVTNAGLIETTTFEGLFTVGPITNSGTIAALRGGARLGLQDDTVINFHDLLHVT